MRREPDFDQLIGSDVPAEERDRLRRAHDLLVRAAPPAELSPELDLVPWPEESQQPLTKPVHRRPLLIAAAIATLVGGGFILGQATAPSSTSLSTERVVRLAGTNLDPNATGTLQLGKADADGNWPMDLHIKGLDRAPEGRLLRPLPDEGRQARRPLQHVQLERRRGHDPHERRL